METDYYRKVIKKYRKENKLSQEKLAELLGYDTTYMSHCETQLGAQIKLNEISDRAMKLLPKDRQLTFKILDELLDRFEQDTK